MGALCKSAAKVQQIFETTKYFVYFLHFFVFFFEILNKIYVKSILYFPLISLMAQINC